VSDSIAYICGGKSKIAYGKRTIPKGFVLESLDAGATWKQVYYSPFEMIWDLSIQNGTKQIECLMYSIFNKSCVRQFDHDFNPHTVFKQNGVFHEMNESKTGTLLCGGQQDFTNKSGKIKWMNGVEYLFPKNGLIWSAKFINGNLIGVGSKGFVYFKPLNNAWQIYQLPDLHNLYEIIDFKAGVALIVGSQHTIAKFTY
jgi:hypothetical protein